MVIVGGPGGGQGAPGGGPGGEGDGTGAGARTNVRIGGPGGGPGMQMNFVPASRRGYKSPFFAGSVRADTQGNLWIRTIPTKAIRGGSVYDVINQKGELIDRVQIPENRTIVGFGADGAVYLAARDNTAVYLERAKPR